MHTRVPGGTRRSRAAVVDAARRELVAERADNQRGAHDEPNQRVTGVAEDAHLER